MAIYIYMKIKNNIQYIDVCTKLVNVYLLDLKPG